MRAYFDAVSKKLATLRLVCLDIIKKGFNRDDFVLSALFCYKGICAKGRDLML